MAVEEINFALLRGRGVYHVKGGGVSDRPKKTVALAEIAANRDRPSNKKMTSLGCKQCNIHLCQGRSGWVEFHKN